MLTLNSIFLRSSLISCASLRRRSASAAKRSSCKIKLATFVVLLLYSYHRLATGAVDTSEGEALLETGCWCINNDAIRYVWHNQGVGQLQGYDNRWAHLLPALFGSHGTVKLGSLRAALVARQLEAFRNGQETVGFCGDEDLALRQRLGLQTPTDSLE